MGALIADADGERRGHWAAEMRRRGFRVLEAGSGYQALDLIGRHAPAVALFRCSARDDENERVASVVGMAYPGTRVILTAGGAPVLGSAVIDDGALPVLVDPIDAVLLDRCLADLLG